MTTFISIENHQATQFEDELRQFDLLQSVDRIRERDFMTDFIFEDINEDEEATLEAIKSDLN